MPEEPKFTDLVVLRVLITAHSKTVIYLIFASPVTQTVKLVALNGQYIALPVLK